jgi:hypothetical protein
VPRPSHAGRWQNRIVGFEAAVDPEQLLANPANWRIHTLAQRAVLEGALDSIGWIQAVIVNTTTSHVVDGHQRIESAISKGEPVPVLYVQLTEDEEKAALATLDPIAALAGRDAEKHDALLAEMRETHGALADLLRDAEQLNHAPLTPPSGDVEAPSASESSPASPTTGQAGVIVLCADEGEQQRVYEELVGRGYSCRVVNT